MPGPSCIANLCMSKIKPIILFDKFVNLASQTLTLLVLKAVIIICAHCDKEVPTFRHQGKDHEVACFLFEDVN